MLDIIYTLYAKNVIRLAYFIVSYQSLKRGGVFGNVEHKYHVCLENGSDITVTGLLEDFCDENNIKIHYKDTAPGLASMMNYANTVGKNPYIMLMQDDWFLLENYNFARSIFMLESYVEYSMVRLNNDNLDKALHIEDDFYEMNPKCDGYYYSDNPHIKKRKYHYYTGPYRHIKGEHGAICENLMNEDAIRVSNEHKIICIDKHIFKHLGVEQTVIKQKD